VIEDFILKLQKSKFRSSFKFNEEEINFFNELIMNWIEKELKRPFDNKDYAKENTK
jgi:hypothetical protein